MVENGRIISRDLDDDEISIDLLELISVILRKLHIIILVGIIFAAIAFGITKFFITPMYTSTTRMYVLARQNENASVTYNDLVVGTHLTKDYMELVKSRPVLEKTIDKLNLKMTTGQLAGCISVEVPEETRILTVSVVYPDPETAKDIADAVREAVSVQITSIMDAESVNTVEEGNLPTAPSSPNMMKNIVIGGFLGCVLAVGIILLKFMMDDTIKTPDDVERYLGLSVLASVPVQPGEKRAKKKMGRRSAKQFAKSLRQRG